MKGAWNRLPQLLGGAPARLTLRSMAMTPTSPCYLGLGCPRPNIYRPLWKQWADQTLRTGPCRRSAPLYDLSPPKCFGRSTATAGDTRAMMAACLQPRTVSPQLVNAPRLVPSGSVLDVRAAAMASPLGMGSPFHRLSLPDRATWFDLPQDEPIVR